jgi:hypothetical protein
VAGRPGVLRVLAGGVLAVPAVAAGRGLGGDRHRAADPGGRVGPDHLGDQRGLHDHRAHQHAAGARSTPQKESAGGVTPEPADHALGRSRGGFTTKIHLACEQGQNVMSLLLTAGQRGDSPQFQNVLDKINVPRMGAGRPRTRPERVRADKAYNSRANRAYLADAASPRPSPSPPTRSATARTAAEPEGVHPGSAPRTTELVTPSNAASTGSNATVEWPPGMTSSPSATRPASTSPSSTTGC